MSMFVGNTYVYKADVRSKLRQIEMIDAEDIIDENLSGSFITEKNYDIRISDIEQEINHIIKILKNYDTSGAIDELEILAEKLY